MKLQETIFCRRSPALCALACVVMLLALPGCRIPCLRYADPASPMPDTFAGESSPQSSASTGITEFFDDPALLQLLVDGLARNQELKIRNEDVQIAYNDVMVARGAIFPFFNLGLRGGMDRESRWTPLGAAEEQLTTPRGTPFPDPVPQIRVAADMWWQVDIWRQLRNRRDAAFQRYIEAAEDRNFLITRLIADTAESYYELASLDRRLGYLTQTIELQQRSLEVARAQKAAGRGTELAVQRFLAEVRKNQSQLLIVRQRIIEVENRINFLVGRFPQMVDRQSWDVINLDSRALSVGVPAQLLLNRRDIQAAEREIAASGLDVAVARASFFPRFIITGGIGYESFEPRFLFRPDALLANAAGELVQPMVNRQAIQAEYRNANARQLQAIYNYQRTVLDAFREVVNNIAKVRNYGRSVQIKQRQVTALEQSVEVAQELFNRPIKEEFARVEYVDVLLATRDLLEARTTLIETKQEQLSAIVRAYQSLGGGLLLSNAGPNMADVLCAPANVQLDLFREMHAQEVIPTPEPVDPAPDAAPLVPPAGDAEALPPPADPQPEN
jgi:NodT family efflux transporter outer membrane factor (OMF) lipoprotein